MHQWTHAAEKKGPVRPSIHFFSSPFFLLPKQKKLMDFRGVREKAGGCWATSFSIVQPLAHALGRPTFLLDRRASHLYLSIQISWWACKMTLPSRDVWTRPEPYTQRGRGPFPSSFDFLLNKKKVVSISTPDRRTR